jgi:hypothetical protein
MDPEGSLPQSQVPATCPYPEPDQSIPYPTSHFLNIHLDIIFYFFLGLPSGLFPSDFPVKILYMPLVSSIRATCTAHLILLDLATQKIFGEEYRSFTSSLCSFLYSTVTSSVLGPNILLNALFASTFSLPSSFNVSDHVSHPYKMTGLTT